MKMLSAKPITLACTLGLFGLITPMIAAAQTITYSGSAVSIPDNFQAGVDIPLDVAGVNGNITDLNFRFDTTGGVCDATIGNANAAVTHTFIGHPPARPELSKRAEAASERIFVPARLMTRAGLPTSLPLPVGPARP